MYRKLVRELSKGYRQRVALAQALIHDPQVVILDEPTSGLDPHQIQEIRQLIRQLARDKTVLLSTHILQEVEAVADRLVIINAGRIVGDGTLPNYNRKRSAMPVPCSPWPHRVRKLKSPSKSCVGYGAYAVPAPWTSLTRFELQAAPGMHVLPELGALAQARGWQVGELQERPPTLEEVFLALTEPQDSRSETGA